MTAAGSGRPFPGFEGPDALLDATRRMIRLTGRLSESRARDVAIAETPADEVWRDGKASLLRYRPMAPPRLGPLVIVHGLIGRQSLTDLEPRLSLVRRLLEAGVDTYAIDWGNPTRADRCRDFADYADLWLGDALDAVAEVSKRTRAALLGICQGGVFAACFAALHPRRLKGLALAVTPIDFHADASAASPGPGRLNLWLRHLPEDVVEALITDTGNVPGRFTGAVFSGLEPARAIARYTADLAEIADDPQALDTFLRMEKWLADRPDQPGALARQWLVDLYRENRLVRGRFCIDGRRVDLSRIVCPVLTVLGRHDHIVPPACARAIRGSLCNVAYREIAVSTGHVGVFVSRKAQAEVAPNMVDWLAQIA